MGNTATFQTSTRNRCSYLLTGDGTVAGPTVASATILADMARGSLRDAWERAYADQAAMRTALLGGGQNCIAIVQAQDVIADTTAQQNQVAIDVDVDAVTATRAEINVEMSDTTGQLAMLHLLHLHSLIR
jgi:hypothetical protein